MAARTPFTVRLSQSDHDALSALADMLGTTVAELAREMLEQAIPQMLDPQEIERHIEAEKRRQLKAAREIRQRRQRTAEA